MVTHVTAVMMITMLPSLYISCYLLLHLSQLIVTTVTSFTFVIIVTSVILFTIVNVITLVTIFTAVTLLL